MAFLVGASQTLQYLAVVDLAPAPCEQPGLLGSERNQVPYTKKKVRINAEGRGLRAGRALRQRPRQRNGTPQGCGGRTEAARRRGATPQNATSSVSRRKRGRGGFACPIRSPDGGDTLAKHFQRRRFLAAAATATTATPHPFSTNAGLISGGRTNSGSRPPIITAATTG